VKFIFRLD